MAVLSSLVVNRFTEAEIEAAKSEPNSFGEGKMYIIQRGDADELWIYTTANGHTQITVQPKNYKYTYKPDSAVAIGDWADDSEQTVTIGVDLDYVANDRIEISYDHDNYWIAEVSTYDASTGEIVFTIDEGVAEGTDSYSIFTFDIYNPVVRNENVLAVKAIYDAYAKLSAQTKFTPHDGDIALITKDTGTRWMPESLGGTFYPAGLYIYSSEDSEWQFLSEDISEGVYEAVQNQPACQVLTSVGKTIPSQGFAYIPTDGSEKLYLNVSTSEQTGITVSSTFSGSTWVEIATGGGGLDLTANYSVTGNWTFGGTMSTRSISTTGTIVATTGTGEGNVSVGNTDSSQSIGDTFGSFSLITRDPANNNHEAGGLEGRILNNTSDSFETNLYLVNQDQDMMRFSNSTIFPLKPINLAGNDLTIGARDGSNVFLDMSALLASNDLDAIAYQSSTKSFVNKPLTAVFQITYIGGTLNDLYSYTLIAWESDRIAVIDSGLYLYIGEDQNVASATDAEDWQLLSTTTFTDTSAGTVKTWAEGNNTDLIPSSKIASGTPSANMVPVYRTSGVAWETLAEAHLPEGLADWSTKLDTDGVIDDDFDFSKSDPVFTITNTDASTDGTETGGIFLAALDDASSEKNTGSVEGYVLENGADAFVGGVALHGYTGTTKTLSAVFYHDKIDLKKPIVPESYATLPTLGSTGDEGALAWDATNSELKYWDGDSWESFGGGSVTLSGNNTWTGTNTFQNDVTIGNATISTFAEARTAAGTDVLDLSGTVTEDMMRYGSSFIEDNFFADQTTMSSGGNDIYVQNFYTNYRDTEDTPVVQDGSSTISQVSHYYDEDDTNFWGNLTYRAKEGTRSDGNVDTSFTDVFTANKSNFEIHNEPLFSNRNVQHEDTSLATYTMNATSSSRTGEIGQILFERDGTRYGELTTRAESDADGTVTLWGRGDSAKNRILEYKPSGVAFRGSNTSNGPRSVIDIRVDDYNDAAMGIDSEGIWIEANTDNGIHFYDKAVGAESLAESGYFTANNIHLQPGTNDSDNANSLDAAYISTNTDAIDVMTFAALGRQGGSADKEYSKIGLRAVDFGTDGRRGAMTFYVAQSLTNTDKTLGSDDLVMELTDTQAELLYNDGLREKVLAEGAYSNVISAGSITGSDTVTVSSVDYSVIQYKIGDRHYYRAFSFGTPDETIVVYDGDETEADDTVPTDLLASGKYITTDTKNY